MDLVKIDPLRGTEDQKIRNQYILLEKLLLELEQKQLPEEVVQEINQEIAQVNCSPLSVKTISSARARTLRLLEKKLEMVPKHHYRNMWLALGIASFGIPLGTVFSISLDNYAFIGVGLPIGLALGIAVGSSLDKKAQESGKQLEFENK